MLIGVYDTETTGLPSRWDAGVDAFDVWPHVVQFGLVIVDTDVKAIVQRWGTVVRVPPDVPIDETSVAVHGITRTISEAGLYPQEVLQIAAGLLSGCERLACHNVGFDRPVMTCMAKRHGGSLGTFAANLFLRTPHNDTMLETVDFCQIPGKRSGEWKWPRLEELYQRCFGKPMAKAHDALADATATAECLLYLSDRTVIRLGE